MNKYVKVLSLGALVAVLAVLAGCASPVTMVPAVSQEVRPAPANMAQVVFMRTSFVGAALGVELFEVVNGDLKFIGALNMGKKIVYQTTPGQKVFMAHGVNSDYMLGNLSAGRTYYSIVRPTGAGAMIPTPVRADGTSNYNTSIPEFKKWVSDTQLIEPNRTEAQAWFSKEKDRYQKFHDQFWPVFQQKTAAQKDERTLRPQDGLR
jgi:hypothetical protein